jgi:serine/threonine-protein kinase
MLASAATTEQVRCPRCAEPVPLEGEPAVFCPACGADLRKKEERTAGWGLVGQVVADRYRLLSLLGEGGMGAVYKAEHIRMGKALAVKVLRGAFAREPGAVARFRAEAQIVSRLSHPHTIAVFDFGEIEGGGGFYLAMEYVPGKDLAAVLREQGPLPEWRAAGIAVQLLGSLAEAHDAGIVHRDVKPANVMLMPTRSGEDFVKVLDFGIAKLRDAAASGAGAAGGALGDSASATSSGAIIGTPNYLSPEQARGEPLDARADLYSVGAVLYELVSGRCPFVAPDAMAVVSAHLKEKPMSLRERVTGLSPGFDEIVLRALEKRPKDRFQSADEMCDAILRLDEGSARIRSRRERGPEFTGKLRLARREDFADLERHLRRIRRGRAAGLLALLAVAAIGLLAWRWGEVYGFLHAKAPRLTAALPGALRPADHYDGNEHEPNDAAAQANALPIPSGPDGRLAGGVATMRGRIGDGPGSGEDVDVFRIEVPRLDRPRSLHAEWSGERPGEGIPGVDVALTLNRDAAGEGPRRSAPVVAKVDRGKTGRPEELVAAVGPGTYYLAVREKRQEATGKGARPSGPYLLRVWLAEPQAGEETEPNDAPDPSQHKAVRYPEWKSVGERNPLGEGRVVHGNTSPEDPDLFSVAPRGPADVPELLAIVPETGLAVSAQLWVPDEVDLGPARTKDRTHFEKPVEGAPGQVLFLRLPAVPVAGAPDLVRLRGKGSEGRYAVTALGQGSSSGPAVLRLLGELERDGRGAQALELAAGFARNLPGSSARTDVLLAAGKLAERLAAGGDSDLVAESERAARILGAPIFEAAPAGVRYTGAFETLAVDQGQGRFAEEAALRLIPRASPCAPSEVSRRANAFLQRFPGSTFAPEARLWLARAAEDEYWRAPSKSGLKRAIESYEAVAKGKGDAAAEARKRVKKLTAKKPERPATPRVVCR